jgi:hypothetical protein
MKTIVSRFKGRAVATACGVFAVLLAACGGGAGSV